MPEGFEVSKTNVLVKSLDYVKWPQEGWSTEPPAFQFMAFLLRNIEVKHRPFIVIDFRGLIQLVKVVVNARVQEIRRGDWRLFVVYLYDQGGQEVASWGELLFLDGDYRYPPIERYDLRGKWAKFKEAHWPRKGVTDGAGKK
jgi:hypothetical protein